MNATGYTLTGPVTPINITFGTGATNSPFCEHHGIPVGARFRCTWHRSQDESANYQHPDDPQVCRWIQHQIGPSLYRVIAVYR